ncbi:hypothetical protein CXB51_004240 [Gossypium anomalum]|uniref:Uncharacterized protein n=1 Tax=Gossypium anomalum TaxID=47600 RepID=A0A8J5ZZI5_9ROSI|nr:hypothetical protein CXB51_004240 [Gossypium anomalum]
MGPMSFAERNQICEEEKYREISQLERFHYQHYKDDGTSINEHAEKLFQEALTKLKKIVSEIGEPMTQEERIALENEVYKILIGPNLHGRTRVYGLGVTSVILQNSQNTETTRTTLRDQVINKSQEKHVEELVAV